MALEHLHMIKFRCLAAHLHLRLRCVLQFPSHAYIFPYGISALLAIQHSIAYPCHTPHPNDCHNPFRPADDEEHLAVAVAGLSQDPYVTSAQSLFGGLVRLYGDFTRPVKE